jgi:hypothetical protein
LALAALLEEVYSAFMGLSPEFKNINQLNSIQKPLQMDDDDPIVYGLVWSDPVEGYTSFSDNSRGKGFAFSLIQMKTFQQANNIRLLVRGYQCVSEGI